MVVSNGSGQQHIAQGSILIGDTDEARITVTCILHNQYVHPLSIPG